MAAAAPLFPVMTTGLDPAVVCAGQLQLQLPGAGVGLGAEFTVWRWANGGGP